MNTHRRIARTVLSALVAFATSACGPSLTTSDAADVVNDVRLDTPSGTDAPLSMDSTLETDTSAATDAPSGEAAPGNDVVLNDATDATQRADVVPADAGDPCRGTITVAGFATRTDALNAVTTKSREFQMALANASGATNTGLTAPRDGSPMGRVYLSGGFYVLEQTDVPSNVRIEIDPSATLINGEHSMAPRALFNFGREIRGSNGTTTSTAVRNIVVTAGDGCGGPGTPTMANKPRNTAAHGNDPATNGMTDITDGSGALLDLATLPYWGSHLPGMWLLDLDGHYNGTNEVNNYGFLVANAYDVTIESLFSIENPERGTTNSFASSRAVMHIKPPSTAAYYDGSGGVIPRENVQSAHRLTVSWHFNILSPAGYGANQVQGCFDCRFENIFSHGGTPLRFETDGPPPIGNNGLDTGSGPDVCSGVTGTPDGTGFPYFANVDGVTGDHIEGMYGGIVVLFSAHCRANGQVGVTNVRGTGMQFLAAFENANNTSTGVHGSFAAGTFIRDMQGTPTTAALAQSRVSSGTWIFQATQGAMHNASDWNPQVRGSVCWPSSPRLVVGSSVAGGYTQTAPPCPAW